MIAIYICFNSSKKLQRKTIISSPGINTRTFNMELEEHASAGLSKHWQLQRFPRYSWETQALAHEAEG